MQKMTGRSRSESVSSFSSSQALHRSSSDELTNRASVLEIISKEDSLDDAHPILEDDNRPLIMSSFGSERSPDTGLRGEDDSSKENGIQRMFPSFMKMSLSEIFPME